MASRFHLPLRISQVLSPLAVLGLSIYVGCQHKAFAPGPAPIQINFLTFVSCLSLIFTLYLELVHKFAPYESIPYIPYLRLGIEGAISLFYLGGFIALVVFLSKQHVCSGNMCVVVRADAVFAALSYVVWVVSATINGIEISRNRFEERVELRDDMTEKIIVDVLTRF